MRGWWISLLLAALVVPGCAERPAESHSESAEELSDAPPPPDDSSQPAPDRAARVTAVQPTAADSSALSDRDAGPPDSDSGSPVLPQDLPAAMSQCGSSVHERAVDQVLSQDLHEQVLEETRLWSGIAAAYRDCGNERVVDWVRTSLDVDLAPDAYRHVVRIALALDESSVDERLLEIAEHQDRDPSVAAEILEGFAFVRMDGFESMPELIATSYRAGRLSPVFLREWGPLLLGSDETRDEFARLGAEALLEEPGLRGGGVLFEILAIDVSAYSFRFGATARAAVETLVERYSTGWRYQGERRVVADARSRGENSRGQRVDEVSLAWSLEWANDACRPVWPDRLARVVDEVAEGVVLMTGDGGCERAEFVVADFDGDGSEDVVLKGSTVDGGIFLLVMNGRAPYAQALGPSGQEGSVGFKGAGYYSLDGCFNDVLDDGRLFLPHDGFTLSTGEFYSWDYVYFEGYKLVRRGEGFC